MTPNQTIIFIEAFHHCATTMGWNQGARQITLFANSAGRQVDIIKSYGQINKATLKSACVRFLQAWGSQIPDPRKAEQHKDEHLPSKVANG